MILVSGIVLGLLPFLLVLRALHRSQSRALALVGPSGQAWLRNKAFRQALPTAEFSMEHSRLSGPAGPLRAVELLRIAGTRLVLLESARVAEVERAGLLERLLVRFEEGGAVHHLVQQVLDDSRQVLDVAYLDLLLRNPAEDEARDPYSDAEHYLASEEQVLLALLEQTVQERTPDRLWRLQDIPRGAKWVPLVDFMRSRDLDRLLVIPLNAEQTWQGGLLVGWAAGAYSGGRHRLALELCVLLQTQLQNRRTLRQLKLLNRELRDGLAQQSLHVQQLELRLRAKQRELDDAEAAAAESSRLKVEFLASMSHELRTPLNAIKGYTSIVLKEEGLSARQQLSLERVRTSSDTLLKLINDILDYSRMESGKLSLDLELVNASSIARETVAHLEPLAHERELDFGLQSPDPDIYAVLDRSKLERILINLLGNAIKFTDRGSVALVLFRREGMLVFEVRDTGIGIHPDERQLIFQHFRQGDGSSKRQHGGTGLGLAITARLVELLGGRLELDSELGRGSTFRVYLPIFLDLDTARQVLDPRSESPQPA